ncbi:MAG TPA: DNA gyrase modulator, partial [Gemmatimonadaceae bacterium]|nr:DNA gyrase modulator [Gemmatimonadaceae bacterium]
MGGSRREFLKTTSTAAAAMGLAACAPTQSAPAPAPTPAAAPPAASGDPTLKELALLALDAARSAGAQYADIRISTGRTQSVVTREARVQAISDNESFGFGVRALVGGAWGFAASAELSRDEVARVARQAVAQARANQ